VEPEEPLIARELEREERAPPSIEEEAADALMVVDREPEMD
jgi:hypothetical protein